MPDETTTTRDKTLDDIAKSASLAAAKNSGVAPQMLFAPILFALQDAVDAGQIIVKEVPHD